MQFKIVGADRETGEEKSFIVNADNKEAALSKANAMGFLVSGCKAVADTKKSDAGICRYCRAQLLPDAAFCARCGKKSDHAADIEDHIEYSAIVPLLIHYGEISELQRQGAATDADLLEKVKVAIRNNDVATILFIEKQSEKLLEITDKACLQGEACKQQLLLFDLDRLRKVRELIIHNDKVPEATRRGLEADMFQLFSDKPTQLALDASSSKAKAASQPLPFVQPAGKKQATTGWYVAWGLTIVGGLMACAILWAIQLFLENPHIADKLPKVIGVGIVGIIMLSIGLYTINAACPNCRALFTGKTLATESLGSHYENRTEQRVAKNYNPHNRQLQSETHYEVNRVVEVETLLDTRRCKKCSHTWQVKRQRES